MPLPQDLRAATAAALRKQNNDVLADEIAPVAPPAPAPLAPPAPNQAQIDRFTAEHEARVAARDAAMAPKAPEPSPFADMDAEVAAADAAAGKAPAPAPEPTFSEAPEAMSESRSATPEATRPERNAALNYTPAPAAEPAPAAPAEATPAPRTARPAATKAAPGVTVVVQSPVAEPKVGETPTDDQLLAAGGKGVNAGQPAPAPSAAPSAPPAPAPGSRSDGVEDLPYDPSVSTKELRARQAMGVARGGEIRGDIVENLEGLGQGLAAKESERSGLSREGIAKLEGDDESRRARAEATRADFEQEMADLKRTIGTPPKNTVGIVMGLVSALAAAKGKPGAAAAFAALGEQMNSPMRRWQAEVAAGKQNLEGMGKLINMDRLSAQDDATAQQAIMKANDAEMNAGFDYLIKNAKNEADRLQAVEGQNVYNQQANARLENMRKRQAAAAYRARARAAIDAETTPEGKLAAAHRFGAVGGKELQGTLKSEGALVGLADKGAGVALKEAQTGAAQAKAGVDAAKAAANDPNRDLTGTGILPGYTETRPLTPQIRNDLAKDARLWAQIDALNNRQMVIAREIAKNGKDWFLKDATAQKEIKDIMRTKAAMKNQASGAGTPTGDEMSAQLEADADPQEVLTRQDALEVLARQNANYGRMRNAAYRSIGIVPDAEYQAMRAKGTAPKAQPAGRVTLRNKSTGELLEDIPEDQAAATRNLDSDWEAE